MMKYYLLLLLLLTPIAQAVDKNPTVFTNPEYEERYYTLIKELRCVQCQNQSIADSNAGIAQDLREIVRQQIRQGKTNDEIKNYLVERYNDYILYNPPLKPATYLLWLGPFILLIAGFALLIYQIMRHSKRTAEPEALTDTEQQKIHHALKDNT